jgi:hypothetical protein
MVEKYQEILKEHGDDVLAVTGEGFFHERTLSAYYNDPNTCGNVESDFCICLTAVMLLKRMGIFDRNGKLTKVKNIGGGYYNDGDNFGLVFEYNSQKYALTSKPLKEDEDVVYIPLDENSKEIISKINECCYNRYVINFNTNQNNPNSRKS